MATHGFDLGPLLDRTLTDGEARVPAARELVAAYALSFVAAAGRQYVQVHDLYTLAALLADPGEGAHRRRDDWRWLYDPTLAERIAAWPLPGRHTSAPARTPGQVAGIYRFWWSVACDAIRARIVGVVAPRRHQLDERMDHIGVPLYVTTSTTWEEMAGVHDAYRTVAKLGVRPAPQALVRASLTPRLAAELYWQTWRRPRRRDADGRDVDPHASVMATFIPQALARPLRERTPYDRLWALVAAELDRAYGSVAALHERAVAAYNANHPDTPVTALHRSRELAPA